MKVLICGAGYSGSAIGKALLASGAEVAGTTRSRDRVTALEEDGLAALHFDGNEISGALAACLETTTHLISCIAPPRKATADSDHADPVLAALAAHAGQIDFSSLQWIGYLSTVGVYGNHDGAWVDEDMPPKPVSDRSVQRVTAEKEWQDFAARLDLPLGIFRLSGIYGPGRNAFIAMTEGRARRLVKKDQVFNRIHVADIASALALASGQKAKGLFNITDDEPAPPQDVVAFAHELAGQTPPPEIDFETASLTPMARSFYGENKRVSNARSKSVLGLDYAYPNYRIALRDLWESGRWK